LLLIPRRKDKVQTAKTSFETTPHRAGKTKAEALRTDVTSFIRLIIYSRKFRHMLARFIKITRRVFLRIVEVDDKGWESSGEEEDRAKGIPAGKTGVIWQLQEKTVPSKEEEIDFLIDDLVEIIAEIHSTQKYHHGFKILFEMGEMLYTKSQDVVDTLSRDMPHTHRLEEHTKELVAEFSGRRTLDRFMDLLEVVTTQLRDSDEARAYIEEFRDFIIIRQPEAQESEEFRRRARALIDKGRDVVERLNNSQDIKNFLDTGDQLVENIKNDELVMNLREKAGTLKDEFTYMGPDGQRKVDMDLVQKIQKQVVPILADALKYIPIPKVEYSDRKLDLSAENIVFSGYDIVPENVRAHMESDSHFSFKELDTQKSESKLVLELRNIRTEVKNIHFYFKRKKFPVMSDSGNVTLRVRGEGANLTIILYIVHNPGEQVATFHHASIDLDIRKLDIEFDKSTIKHDQLLPIMTTLFKQKIKHKIEHAVEKNLEPVLNSLGKKLTESLKESEFQTKLELVTDTLKEADTHKVLQLRHEKLDS
jgi:mRNA-degrading endonuclease YafQ of YafQ-DinJ toxin-antitoxin module